MPTTTLRPGDHRLERVSRSVLLRAAPDEVFAFCTSLTGFLAQMPQKVTRTSGDTQWVLGSEFWIHYHYLGVPMKWHGRVTQYEPKRSFTDLLVSGMFRYWEHRHSEEPVPEGTRHTDTVVFTLGLGPLVDRFVAKPLLERFFQQRHALLEHALARRTHNSTSLT
jgi:ligand-binding SRPBCC domain-containing protein